MKGKFLQTRYDVTFEIQGTLWRLSRRNKSTQMATKQSTTTTECALRTQGFPVVKLSHVVVELPVHGPGEESLAFVEGQEYAALDDLQAGKKRSKLMAFFDMCDEYLEEHGECMDLLYCDVGMTHWFNYKKNARCWIERERRHKLLCRVLSVSPKNVEVYAVRLLLHHVKGPTSFEDLRTVTMDNGEIVEFSTFTEAARHYGLLEDPNVWVKSINDAADEFQSAWKLLRYFAALLVNAAPPQPQDIFDEVLDRLWPPAGQSWQTPEWRRRKTLNHLEYCFRQFNTTCREMLGYDVAYNETEALRDDELGGVPTHVGADAGAGHRRSWKQYWQQNYKRMNEGQENAFSVIKSAVEGSRTDEVRLKLFMLEGAGGTGKSFVYNTLVAWCRDNGYRVAATASTGIAATVLIGGKTLHSTFWIPLEVTDKTESRVKAHKEYAEPIKQVELVLVDEISMLHRDVLKYLDTMFKDVCNNKDELFAGKVVVIGGDWKQLCPVVKNMPRELAQAAIVNASVKSSSLYRQFHKLPLTQNMRVKKGQQEWADYIAKVGNGKTLIPGTSEMEVDTDLLVPTEEALIEFTFPQKLLDAPFANTAALLEAAILAPKLDTVRRLNDRIRLLLAGTDIVCASTDAPMSEDPLKMLDVHYAAQNVEHLNRGTEEGMPPHLLTFRKGMVLVLMRNIDQYMGLCNAAPWQRLAATR
ncbi:helitron helicase-like protein [Aphelenchoides avenae]|nr:helitron helicase-like protein [Aphelenchus avenae]